MKNNTVKDSVALLAEFIGKQETKAILKVHDRIQQELDRDHGKLYEPVTVNTKKRMLSVLSAELMLRGENVTHGI
jgi:hypothetical protein